MKEVKLIKYPTSKQIQRMLNNLSKKYNAHMSIERRYTFFRSDRKITERFFFYIADVLCQDNFTWEQLQNKYFELMKGK